MKIQIPGRSSDVYLDAFFPKSKGRSDGLIPVAIICPGGGYRIVGTTEGRPVSDKFVDAGYAAFILNYTVGDDVEFGDAGFKDFAPMLDLKAAMCLLHENAEEYGIDVNNIMLAGFSAGGHLAAAYCLSTDGALAKTESGASPAPLPNRLMLTYAMGGGPDSGGVGKPQPAYEIAGMPYSDDPALRALPIFFWHAKDDQMVPYVVSERLDQRLTKEGIPHYFLSFEHGLHARPFLDPSWFPIALDWLNKREIIQ